MFVGEIKVARNLTLSQAFRAALGQVLEYAHLLFDPLPQMVIFLDNDVDERRLKLATKYGITVITWINGTFVVRNPNGARQI